MVRDCVNELQSLANITSVVKLASERRGSPVGRNRVRSIMRGMGRGDPETGHLPLRKAADPLSRFMAMVQTGDGCWIWQGSFRTDGYGQFYMPGRTIGAHRVSFELHAGRPVADGAFVCHTCDVRACVNPQHLYEGNDTTNTADKVSRLRLAYGDSVAKKLSSAKVAEIRLLLEGGATQVEVASTFGVSQSTVSRIKSRIFWRRTEIGPSVEPRVSIRQGEPTLLGERTARRQSGGPTV